jgi:hypothetical protein
MTKYITTNETAIIKANLHKDWFLSVFIFFHDPILIRVFDRYQFNFRITSFYNYFIIKNALSSIIELS